MCRDRCNDDGRNVYDWVVYVMRRGCGEIAAVGNENYCGNQV